MNYDYIIVGGGSSGCVLANRISQDPAVSVLLVEAGGKDKHPFYSMPAGFAKMTKGRGSWGWSTTPQKHLNNRILRFTQAKVIGGGSSINAQIYTRGVPSDYDEWSSEYGAVGWSFQEVLPYFKKSENNVRFSNEYHNFGGPLGVSNPVNPLPISEAFLQAGQCMGIPYNPDFNGETQEGIGYYQLTQIDAKRCSTSRAFLHPAKHRKNLTVRTDTQVKRVIVEQGRATGIEMITSRSSNVQSIYCNREVLLSSGALGSPKLLMLSGIGPADHLKEHDISLVFDAPEVGSNLQDHLDIFTISECRGNFTYDKYAKPLYAAWAGMQYLLFKHGPVASSLFETGGFWYADPDARTPDIQLHLGLGSGIESGVEKMKNSGITLNSAFLRPRSRGTVRLSSKDPLAAPLIDPNYWADPYDRKISLDGLRLAREILSHPALERYILAECLPGKGCSSEKELFDYACRNAKTDHHPVGTCRMGSDTDSVVDPSLRVRGIEGLRVVDASVMPRIVSSNTNAPTIMIAEKAADLISQTY